jgi:tetratricopeptide (TPR) repeat protein
MKALEALDRVPEGDRSGDYLLMKARLLDLAGQPAESDKVLDEGMKLAISRPRVCRDAALMLVRRNRMQAALDLLNRADGTDPELWLTKAVLLGLMNQSPAAEKTLKTIQSQWPEWDRPYLVHGLLLERTQPAEAVQRLRMADALGQEDLATRCALARLAVRLPADPQCSCAGGLYELLFPPCSRP